MTDAVPQYRPASITLVRHGQSESNLHDPDSVQDVPKELRGTPNHKVQLTPLGHEQARATGAALAARLPDGFDHIYVSPFKRTLQTADALLSGCPEAWRARLAEDRRKHDILLREQDFGYADVVGAVEGTAEYVEAARARFKAHTDNAGKFYTRPDNGESWADVCQRTYMFLGKLFQPNRHGAHILIVSHATTILTFPFHLERMSEDQLVDLYLTRKIQNCAVGRFEYRPTERPRWARTLWNDVMHGLG
jgi:broad specificity phosphatase PhoE